jgi:predicted nucleotidyltransferase
VLAYIYDFLSLLSEEPIINREINEIILFGSTAKGTNDKESDIDLFFNVKNKTEEKGIEEIIVRLRKSFEVKAEKTWKLKNVFYPINFIVGSLEDERWKSLKEEIISSGILLYSNYKGSPENIKQKYMIYYSLSNLDRKEKMKLIRNLLGYSIRKNKKEYKQEGLLKEKAGTKIGQNVILIDKENLMEIKELLSRFKVKYKIMEVWIKQ